MGERAEPGRVRLQHSQEGSGGQGQAAVLSSGQKERGSPVACAGVLGLRAVWLATSGAWASILAALKWTWAREGDCGVAQEEIHPYHTQWHTHSWVPRTGQWALGSWARGSGGQRDREELAYHPDAKERVGVPLGHLSPPVTPCTPGPLGYPTTHRRPGPGILTWG